MRYDSALLTFYCFLAASCAYTGGQDVAARQACIGQSNGGNATLRNIAILVTLDQHGGFAAVKACPLQAFSVDFSRSELFMERYSALLKQMQLDSMTAGISTQMTVSGDLRKKTGDELRDTILVGKIISYRLH